MLQKIQMLRKERLAGKSEEVNELNRPTSITDNTNTQSDDNIKRKLIMKTIEDIKRSLEDQSLELNEMHDSDN